MKPFNKVKPFSLRWNEPLGRADCPYAFRYVFTFFNWAIRIHRWLRSDDKRYLHNHSWWFLTLVLRGSYTDVDSHGSRDLLMKGSIRFRPASHTHYVEVPEGGALTILLTGPPVQKWGFFVGEKFIRPLKFFHRFGHPECMD